jgi:hypothetical protein
MGLEDMITPEMLHYLPQFNICVINYQLRQTHKNITLPVRDTILRHSQHLKSRVVFDRNLIDCLNLKLKQKQEAKKAKQNHIKAKAVAVLPKTPKTHAMLMQMRKPI